MKKALFALSLLVVAPMIKAEDVVQAAAVEIPAAVVETSVAVETPASAPINPPSKNIFAQGVEKAGNVVASVKNSTVNGVVFVKDGIFYAYDKVTGTVEAFTPNMILNARDSVRSTIANYPLTAIALTAFVTVRISDFFSASCEVEDEDDSF